MATDEWIRSCDLLHIYIHMYMCVYIYMYIYCCCCHCSITKLCPTLYSPIDYGILGSSDLHYLLEFAPIHIHSVGDAI